MTCKEALHTILDSYGVLPENWNDNGAKAFSSKLINRCHEIVDGLKYSPFLSPTGCNSIQFEFDHNDSYIEFEVYEDKIKVYSSIPTVLRPLTPPVRMERYETLPYNCSVNELNERVREIYE